MDAADQKGRLPVLVLHVDVDPAPDQELHDTLFVVFAGEVQRRRELSVYHVGLGSRALNQNHQHFVEA